MNIFFFDVDPTISATDLCDKHIVKMPTETVQIISTAYYLLSGNKGLYKPTHAHHPCVVWASKSKDNLLWLVKYANALGVEYTKRYNKTHLAITKLNNWLTTIDLNILNFSESNWSSPPKCMPVQHHQQSTIESYKEYYRKEKLKFACWKYTNKPNWI